MPHHLLAGFVACHCLLVIIYIKTLNTMCQWCEAD